MQSQPFLRSQGLIDGLHRHLSQMFDKFENLEQFRFRAGTGQLDGPAQIALDRVELLQWGQILSVQLANAHSAQRGKIAQQHDGVGAA